MANLEDRLANTGINDPPPAYGEGDGAGGGGKPKKKKSKPKVRGASAVTKARDEGYNLAIQNMESCAPEFRVPPPLIREAYNVTRERIAFLEGCFAKQGLEVPSHLAAEAEAVQSRLLVALSGVEVYERHMTAHAEEEEPKEAPWRTEYEDLLMTRNLQLLEEEEKEGAAADL